MNLSIPQDAFSDGQVRSKLWLANNLSVWSKKHFTANVPYTLTWYGSWIGLGPFLLLSLTDIKFSTLNLIELDNQSLETSRRILDHWINQGVKINLINEDMNQYMPDTSLEHQLFLNTACEHVLETAWLERIPKGSKILLQSTDMVHHEHINPAKNLTDFKHQMDAYLTIQESSQLDVIYTTMAFSRFMLLGTK